VPNINTSFRRLVDLRILIQHVLGMTTMQVLDSLHYVSAHVTAAERAIIWQKQAHNYPLKGSIMRQNEAYRVIFYTLKTTSDFNSVAPQPVRIVQSAHQALVEEHQCHQRKKMKDDETETLVVDELIDTVCRHCRERPR